MATTPMPQLQNGHDTAQSHIQPSSTASLSSYAPTPPKSFAGASPVPVASTTDSSPTTSFLEGSRSPRSPSLQSTTSESALAGSTLTSISATSVAVTSPSAVSDDPDVAEPILEALRSTKERLFMLKLGETMESLIRERSPTKPYPRTTLTPATSYHRLLIHKCCNYHRVTPEVDQANKTINLIVTLESRIPVRRIRDLVPPENNTNNPAPSIKIMRRNTPEQRSKSRNTDVPSSSASTAEVSPSIGAATSTESGSPPSVNGTTSTDPTDDDEQGDSLLRALGIPPTKRAGTGTSTPRKTLEEREAAYNEARSRIFMDLPEKERAAARMREDREREREATEMHRKLAEEEDLANSVVHEMPRVEETPAEIRQQFLAANAHLQIRPATTGPGDHAAPLQLIRGVTSPAAGPSRDLSLHGLVSTESEQLDPAASAPLISYPSLYDTDSTREAPLAAPPQTRPQQNPNGHPYSLNVSAPPYDPNTQHFSSPLSARPPYNYAPYPMGMGPINGAPPMMMSGYGYGPQQPGQPFPYYPPMGPPPPGWNESQPGYAPPPQMDGAAAENGYGYYPPMQHPPQQQYWSQQQGPPPHPPGPSGDGRPPPPMPNQPYPMTGAPPSFSQYYGNPMSHQQFVHQQRNGFSPQPPAQGHQQQQYHPNQRAPLQQGPGQQRQLWTPDGASNRRPSGFSGGASRNQPGRGGPPPQANGTQRGPARGTPPRDPRENPRDLTTLMATPMNQTGTVMTRSRNSSVSTTSSAAAFRSSFIPGSDTLPPLMVRTSEAGNGISLVSMRQSWHQKRRSGSISGSVSETISVAGDEPGTRTPLDETASMSSSMSSTSVRTYTSTSSKHPSLPARPDWAIFPTGSPSISGRSSHRGGRSGSSSSSSNAAHSRTHSFQSNGRSPYVPQSTDFPPLPGPQQPNLATMHLAAAKSTNSVWGNRPAQVMMAPPPNRLDEEDAKFARPAAKGSAQLFDPKAATKAAAAARAATPVGGDKTGGVRPPAEEQLGSVTAGLANLQVEEVAAQPGTSA